MPTPRQSDYNWGIYGICSSPGSIAEKSLENFNSRSLNALLREVELAGLEFENLQLTGLGQGVT